MRLGHCFLILFLAGCSEEKSVAEKIAEDKAKAAAEAIEAKLPKPKVRLRDNAPISRTLLSQKINAGVVRDNVAFFADTLETVVGIVGNPDNTQESGNTMYVYYDNLTKDELTGKVDRRVQLVFEGAYRDVTNSAGTKTGKVERVWYLLRINFG